VDFASDIAEGLLDEIAAWLEEKAAAASDANDAITATV